jgi:hypothetical protein
MLIIGCDLHSRYQVIVMVDTETGEAGVARGSISAPRLSFRLRPSCRLQVTSARGLTAVQSISNGKRQNAKGN